jgi:hypothetical protein
VQPIINQNMEHNLENPFSNNLDMGNFFTCNDGLTQKNIEN